MENRGNTEAIAGREREGNVIFTGTRAQAIADGALVDVTATAKQANILFPTALSAGLYRDLEAVPEEINGLATVELRLWDCLFMFTVNYWRQRPWPLAFEYRFILPLPGRVSDEDLEEGYPVKVVIGPGDDGEPVITLMRVDED